MSFTWILVHRLTQSIHSFESDKFSFILKHIVFISSSSFFVWAAMLFSERNTSERKNLCLHYFDYLKRPHRFFGFLTIWVWLVGSVYFQLKNRNFWAWLKKKKSYKFIKQNYAVRVNGCITNSFIFKIFLKHKIVKQNPMSAMYSKGLNCIPGSLYFEESNAFKLLLLTWPYKLWNISAGSKTD